MPKEIQLPSLGEGIDTADVFEVLVSPGDTVEKNDIILVLESDKATLEVPATEAGVVSKVFVSAGDQIKPGDNLLSVEVKDHPEKSESETNEATIFEQNDEPTIPTTKESVKDDQPPKVIKGEKRIESIKLPDLGEGIESADISEVLVEAGDKITKDDPIIVLESEKATMEVPSGINGTVVDVFLKAGEAISSGSLILSVETEDRIASDQKEAEPESLKESRPVEKEAEATQPVSIDTPSYMPLDSPNKKPFASPGVRRFARELGADISWVRGTGDKRRITKEDVQSYVKSQLAKAKLGGGPAQPKRAPINFAQWGAVEEKPLSRIRKITAQRLGEAWQSIPHVTQFDTANISELESYRKSLKQRAEKRKTKLTPIAFLLKACAQILSEMPDFNSSLDDTGENQIFKKYIHIGIAVDTPNGLVVPVMRDVDQKDLWAISTDLIDLSSRARDKKLKPEEMKGGCFTISSLGGISGTYFTPIINPPEVAILGVSRSGIKPVWDGKNFKPQNTLPYSLSYDHRTIDGAAAAMFTKRLREILEDESIYTSW